MSSRERSPYGLPGPVWRLGWVSFFTDAASELIYPLLPFFLTSVLGAGAVSLGLIEGVAEAANSALKVMSGRLSDRWSARRPIVLGGYTLSSLARPLIAVATAWPQVLAIRFFDRVGKGIRGAPRDAMLAEWASPEQRGLVFGFHRGMDHAGAVVGPLLATAFLFLYPARYRTLFALTMVPGVLAVVTLATVPESRTCRARHAVAGGDADLASRRELPRPLWRFLIVVFLFTLGNSTDAFLLLRLTDAAGGVTLVPLFWSALHVVKAATSVAGGRLSDRMDRRVVIACGWVVYAVVYAGFAISGSLAALVTWFLIYGFYFGLTEGVEKALVADLAPEHLRGTVFGIYNAVLGVGALVASIGFGLLWTFFGAPIAFGTGAVLALVATVLLFTAVPRQAPFEVEA